MAMFETVDNSVPQGQYRGDFKGTKEIIGQWGTRLQWPFEITEGEHLGATVSGFSGAERASLKSNLCKFLFMLEGDSPRAGISRDPADYIGRPYTITVTEGDNGSTKVTSFKPSGTPSESSESREDAISF